MAVVTAPDYVNRPGPGAELQPYGLFTAAGGPWDLPYHAVEGGLDYETPYCGLPSGYAVACAPGSKSASLTGGYTTVNGDPFMVLAGMECGIVGMDEARSRNLVLGKLRAGEQRVVENIFSRQLVGQSPGLSNGGATVVAPLATNNILTAFGVLEAAYGAAYGLPGVFHVPLLAMPKVMDAHLVERVGAVWRTASGHAVSFGNYAGRDATDGAPAAGHTNIYLTGPVNVWRQPDSEIFVSPFDASLDKVTNQLHRFAERAYVVTWECVAFVTDLDLTTCC